ncbi:MAG: hypothetical protein ACRDJH_06685, partial [Thermomicrobiales bacterium]
MSDERLPVPHGDQAPTFGHRTTSPLVRRGLARLSAMAAAGPRASEIALSEEDRPVLLWSFKGYGDKGDETGLARPPMLALIPEDIPRELSERRQWICWDNWGGPISPITGGGSNVSPRSTWECFEGEPIEVTAPPVDPRTWGSFEEARAFASQYSLPGIDLVLTEADPFAVVELDECRNPETGELDPWALRIVADLNSYTELSPSGRGLHIIVRGTLPPFDPCHRRSRLDLRDRDSYVTCTGHQLLGTPRSIQDRQAELDMLLREPAEVTSDLVDRSFLDWSGRKALALEVAATDLVIIRTWDWSLRALDASTGSERWCFWWPPFRGSTQIVRGVLYTSDDDYLTARDHQTGEDRWSFHPEHGAPRDWYERYIYVLDVVTGEECGRHRIGDDSTLLPPPT